MEADSHAVDRQRQLKGELIALEMRLFLVRSELNRLACPLEEPPHELRLRQDIPDRATQARLRAERERGNPDTVHATRSRSLARLSPSPARP